ncbi:MAG TPA: hypothetical protein VD884_12310 [Ohtaekwangia sp.]|nr:hypothetical protein [Ohtaekwangia sp.]
MKNTITFVVLFLTFSFFSCQDTKEDSASSHPALAEYKNVGHEIPVETGLQWINAYNKKNNTQARIGNLIYGIESDKLENMLSSVDGLTGVAFHYGIDDAGSTHIVAIPINETLKVWSSIPGRVFLDTNTGNEITQSEASVWAQRYKDENPDDLWFHYFGKNVFDEISTIPYFNIIQIVPAIKILDFTPQLLLVIANLDVLDLGRTSTEQNTKIYDASYPCPPCPVD